MTRLVAVLSLVCALAACAPTGPSRGTPQDVAALSRNLRAMSPAVDPAEADRAAALSYRYTYQLAQQYQITDPPLIHNAKVNAGRKPRGLCYHWATDMERLLNREGFKTLEIQRAIANAGNPILIEHSSAVITARGAPMESGVIIDPWRQGGTLFWSPVLKDGRYDWKERGAELTRLGRVTYVNPDGTPSLQPQ
ncbi:hypothetical protein BOO69_10025 [Sulfitobacter alexandrii]|uniref:Lipoprotein n=1 Tax=Sulfitobacter alexandrii TaxID=1917485 RepID=A0A1J0WHR1_9RHOB|nr:hypothetical protein [Sulfitobacter alexandrii]APE43712.1 hypothetical protein BOO69_10025 [Sulfitobacter alexandrii]